MRPANGTNAAPIHSGPQILPTAPIRPVLATAVAVRATIASVHATHAVGRAADTAHDATAKP